MNEEVELRFPVNGLPEGVSLDDVEIYVYGVISDADENTWSPASLKYRYEGTLEQPIYVAELQGLEGMGFIGYHQVAASVETAGAALFSATASEETSCTATCVMDDPWYRGPNPDNQTCNSNTNPNLVVTVHDFGSGARWVGGTEICQMVDWLSSSYVKMNELGMTPSPEFTVKIIGTKKDGYVKTFFPGTLYLTDRATMRKEAMMATAAHEYFHHGQSLTTLDGKDNLRTFHQIRGKWLTESTATWFEDYVFDTESNDYQYGNVPVHRILEVGLDSRSNKSDKRKDRYSRFAFFKLLENRCSGFNGQDAQASRWKYLLNVDGGDSSGIQALNNELTQASCDFGDHLGSEKSSWFEAAMVYYSYVSLAEREITLIDSNETDVVNSPPKPKFFFKDIGPYDFTQNGASWLPTINQWVSRSDSSPYRIPNISNIPPAGAYSFTVPAITGVLPDGTTAKLTVNPSSGEVIVSMRSEGDFDGPNLLGGQPHAWFSANDRYTSHYYGSVTGVPELFVTIVNPSLESAADVKVSFNVVGCDASGNGAPITDTITVDGREWAQVSLFSNLAWDDINAVCPGGVCCSGALNGHDMAGWTWASDSEVIDLFNYYIGWNALSKPPDPYVEYSEVGSAWLPAFFDDGWRASPRSFDYPLDLLGVTRSSYFSSHFGRWVAGGGRIVRGVDYAPDTDFVVSGSSSDKYARHPSVGAWLYRNP